MKDNQGWLSLPCVMQTGIEETEVQVSARKRKVTVLSGSVLQAADNSQNCIKLD